MQRLDACPLCRAALPAGDYHCPDCGADLTAFTDLEQLATRYVELARELISRGDIDRARLVVESLPRISSAAATDIAELWVRIALVEGDYTAARQALAACEPGVADTLAVEITAGQSFQFQARELYNQSLAAAQRGAYSVAAEQLARAVDLAPDDPLIWALKLKADLKCGYYQRCYADLAELDHRSARPADFHGLERLLPPVPGTTAVQNKSASGMDC